MMKLSAHMVSIQNGNISEIKTSKKFEALGIEKSGEDWVTYAHYREQKNNHICQIAFKICECDWYEKENINQQVEMYIQDETRKGSRMSLIYDEKTGFWYERKNYENKVLSVIKAGKFNVFVQSKDMKFNHISPDINILPSSISNENYEIMLWELQSMIKTLIQDNRSSISVKTADVIEGRTDAVDKIINIVKKLEIYLKRIDADTKVSLKRTHRKQNYASIKKFSSKTVKEQIMKPFSNKFSAPAYEETYNIIENQMIKNSLYELETVLKNELDSVAQRRSYLGNELKSVEEFKNSTNLSVDGIKENLENKSLYLSSEISGNEEKYKKIEICKNQLKKLQEINFIKKTKLKKIKLRHTQIFANDRNYIAVWKLLKKINYNNIADDKKIVFNYTKVRDTHNIYEYWCLFKMIDLLIKNQNWRLKKGEDVKRALYRHFSLSSGRLEDFSIELEHDYKLPDDMENDYSNIFSGPKMVNRVLGLKIVFNENTKTNRNEIRRPDYKFIFTKDGKEYYVYLDAKYRDYKMQEREIRYENEKGHIFIEKEDLWEKDIEDVAIGKYIKEFEGTDHEATASFIVHCDTSDKKYINYGGAAIEGVSERQNGYLKMPNHRYGSILLLPNHETSFMSFMRMIEEYHLGIYNLCWKCGEVKDIDVDVEKTVGGYRKYHYLCNSCKEFWVKTHCSNKECNHSIIKHIENYHTEKYGNHWFVSCPSCGR